jgi:hypothetical protein
LGSRSGEITDVRRKSVLGIVAAAVAMLWCSVATPAAGARPSPGLAAVTPHRPMVVVNQSDSSNWSGHSQGSLEQGGTLFTQVSGDWVVPTAKQHGEGAEFSSTWIGIGGGCIDANCTSVDGTLIQAGTEQVVDSKGNASYGVWYELIPAPALSVDLEVAPGDRMHANIFQVVAGLPLWTIELENRTTGASFSTTVPYVSTHGSVEWIVETPLVFGAGSAGLSSMPDLSPVRFDNARKNGQPANLSASNRVRLVDGNTIVALPSDPDAQRDGFNNCTHTDTCPAPGSV